MILDSIIYHSDEGNREIITISGMSGIIYPFYKSTGQNSNHRGTWFPFIRIIEHSLIPLAGYNNGSIEKPFARYDANRYFGDFILENQDSIEGLSFGDFCDRFGNLECLAISLSLSMKNLGSEGDFWTQNRKLARQISEKIQIPVFAENIDIQQRQLVYDTPEGHHKINQFIAETSWIPSLGQGDFPDKDVMTGQNTLTGVLAGIASPLSSELFQGNHEFRHRRQRRGFESNDSLDSMEREISYNLSDAMIFLVSVAIKIKRSQIEVGERLEQLIRQVMSAVQNTQPDYAMPFFSEDMPERVQEKQDLQLSAIQFKQLVAFGVRLLSYFSRAEINSSAIRSLNPQLPWRRLYSTTDDLFREIY